MDEASVIEREEVARRNARELVLVQAETGWTIRAEEILDWRATMRSVGLIAGVSESANVGRVTLLATDGSRGLFVKHERSSKDYLLGHVEHFDGKVAPAHSLRKKNNSTGKLEDVEEKPKHKAFVRKLRRRQLLDML